MPDPLIPCFSRRKFVSKLHFCALDIHASNFGESDKYVVKVKIWHAQTTDARLPYVLSYSRKFLGGTNKRRDFSV